MTREEAIKWLIKPARTSTDIGEIKEREIEAYNMAIEALSAEAKPTVIRSKTLLPTKDFKEWAKRVRETNPNVIVIPCDAEVVSADAVSREMYDDVVQTIIKREKQFTNMVSVVRCKDCRHRDLFSCPLADNDFQKDEDFCSWGERREE